MRRGGGLSNSLCKYKGIRQKKSGKWVAEFCIPPESRIKGSKPREWLGTFATLEEAVEAYNQKSILVCGTPAYSLDHYGSVLRTPCTLPSNQFLFSPPPANQQTSSCTSHQMHMGSYSNSQLWQTSPVLAADVILERREVPPTEKLFSVPIDWLMSSYVPPDIHQLSTGVNSTGVHEEKCQAPTWERTEAFSVPVDWLMSSYVPPDNHQLSTGLNGTSFQGEKFQAPTWARTEASTFRVDGGGMSVLEEPGTDPISLTAENKDSSEEIRIQGTYDIQSGETPWVDGETDEDLISLTAENKDSSEEIRIQDTYDVQNGETPWVDGETGEALKTYRKSWKPKENQVSIPSGKEGPAEKLTTREAEHELDLSTLWMMVEDEDWGSYELRRLCQSKTDSDIPTAATATNGSSSKMVPLSLTFSET
ncbi:hypothetical protein R1sor_025727 [Riccia sorocarpa]|uniref:AP2/ERF domain-containing protein n=1 Tax=Riccia sorocarpa TaxID=122646 RepID=A0ABD3GBG7_9MARC